MSNDEISQNDDSEDVELAQDERELAEIREVHDDVQREIDEELVASMQIFEQQVGEEKKKLDELLGE